MGDIPSTENVRVALVAAALKMSEKMPLEDTSTAATVREGVIKNFEEAFKGAFKAYVAGLKEEE